jgi:Tol biopolymer transport system component
MVGYLDFETGETKRVAKLPWSGVSTLSLSPDGSTLLFDFDRSVESDLVLVDAFR